MSQAVETGRASPTHVERWPILPNIDLTDIRRFTAGQLLSDCARVRDEAPGLWHPEPAERAFFWAVTQRAEVKRVNGDPATFSSQAGGIDLALASPGRWHEDL